MKNAKAKMARKRLGRFFFIILHSAFCIFLAACSSGGAGSHAGENYVVNSARTPFYKYGPAQGMGPDFALLKDQRVTMLSRQFGYSHVATANGQSGYVATDDLAPAPPEPKPSPMPASSRNEKLARHERAPTREEEAQVPLPELPERKPPAGAPGFRY